MDHFNLKQMNILDEFERLKRKGIYIALRDNANIDFYSRGVDRDLVQEHFASREDDETLNHFLYRSILEFDEKHPEAND